MKLALTLLLWLGIGVCYAQTPFRHLQHNNKLRTSHSQSAASGKEVTRSLRPRNATTSPNLNPGNLQVQKVAQRRTHRRQRTAPEHKHFSSQDLYLEIRRGEGMEKHKAQNRKMWCGK